MEELCSNCNAQRQPGSIFCPRCGHRFNQERCPRCSSIIDTEAVFCSSCGYKLRQTAEEQIEKPVVSESHPLPAAKLEVPIVPDIQVSQVSEPVLVNQPNQNKPKKSSKGLIIGVMSIVLILVLGAAVYFARPLWNNISKTAGPTPSPTSNENKVPSPPVYSYEAVKVVRPALYQSTDYIIYFKGSSEKEKELLLTVEIPGFTQKYEQKIILKPQELKMKIRPPMIEGILKTLNTSKDSQIKVTLQDAVTQKYLIQDSKPVSILSKYDMKWVSDDGSETYYQDICAWVTPESPKIKELLRNSVNQLSSWTNGSINAVVGYQQIGGMETYEVSYYQVAAIYETLRSYYKVRYNATPVSTSGSEAQQRIALPADVISQKSGLCIETAVTMASAIEATGMHAMILIMPGHAQVAFESWPQSGDYYLLETTALTESDWDKIIYYLDTAQWSQYLEQYHVTVIDVELARKDGIKPME